jgi:hypothetical protein
MPEKAIENKNKSTKRGLKVAAIAGGLVLVGGVAFAYWTQGGSGSGSAQTGTTDTLVIHQTTNVNGLAPGVPAVPLSGTIDNPSDATVHVSTVTVSIASITGAAGPCTSADYEILGSPMSVPQNIDGHSSGTWSGATIAFKNDPLNPQDGCKGATVNLTYTSS